MANANAHIGRLVAIGLGIETTAGTQVAATNWFPKTSGAVTPQIEKAEDTSGYGNILTNYDSKTVKQMTEVTLEGIVRADIIGPLLKGVFGDVATTGAGPDYDHAFTVDADSNNHPTFSVWEVNTVGTFASTYAMINEFSLTCEAGDYIRYSINLMGKKMTDETEPAYSFLSDPEFLGKDVTVKFADTEAGLSGADAVSLDMVEFTFNKNVLDYQALGDDDVDCFFNQNFTVTGNMEALFTDETLLDYVKDSSEKFMEVSMVNSDYDIGSGVNPSLTFTFGKVTFDDWDKSEDNDGIVTQTLGFTANFNADDGYEVKADLTNETETIE